MEGKYSVYQITSPTGKRYVGYTSLPTKERWRTHVFRATRGYSLEHPFYSEIRCWGADAFHRETLAVAHSLKEALALEKQHIAAVPEALRLNLSPSGKDDARFGGEIFWQRINRDPEQRAAYLAKLSETKRANDWSDYTQMSIASRAWRSQNPREAYRNAHRAIRMARGRVSHPSITPPETQEERKRRLMWRYRRADVVRQNALSLWEDRRNDAGKMADVCQRISQGQKERMSKVCDPEARREMTAAARAAIDREKQGKAASRGLKRYWEDLKADPTRYQELMAKRTASLLKTLERKKHADV